MEQLKNLKGILLFGETNFMGTSYQINEPVSLSKFSSIRLQPKDVSSLLVSEGFKIFLYEEEDFRGEFKIFNGPAAVPTLPGFDNQTSSLIVARTNGSISQDEVQLNFSGQNLILTGSLNMNNVTRLGIPNNGLESVSVGKNIDLKLYDLENFQGETLTISGPFQGGLSNLDRKVSSFTINFKNTPKPPAHDGSNWVWWLIFLLIVVVVIGFLLMKR